MQNIRNARGFTLIELMIVVAIVAILAAIAIPAYQDYTVRSRVSECVAAAAACKTSVTEFYVARAVMPASAAEAGCATVGTDDCTVPTVAGGQITIATAGTLATQAPGNLIFDPVTAGGATPITNWDCTPSTIEDRFLPAECR